MRTAGVVLVVGLVIAALAVTTQPAAVFAGRVGAGQPPAGTSGFITQISPLSDNRQQLLVIDPELHVMSVYHIDAAGEIVLKSVRNFHWDLRMEQFNGTSPLPREIRSLVDQP